MKMVTELLDPPVSVVFEQRLKTVYCPACATARGVPEGATIATVLSRDGQRIGARELDRSESPSPYNNHLALKIARELGAAPQS